MTSHFGLKMPLRQPHSKRRRARLSVLTGTQHPYLARVLDTMIGIQGTRSGRAYFAFASPKSGAGVSHVVRLLAEELVRETGERVLITEALAPEALTSRCLAWAPGGVKEVLPDVWFAQPGNGSGCTMRQDVKEASVDADAHDFGFVLVDCPPLDYSSQAASWGARVDALFLVAAAGETTAEQLRSARTTLVKSGSRLAGIILNKRTYPVPGPLFSLFRRKP